jgi:phenylalanyl-tRNA synthetase beta chain
MLACALGGTWQRKEWDTPAAEADFFALKGILEALLRGLRVPVWELAAGGSEWLHPGRSARLLVAGDCAGEFGELRPSICAAYGVKLNTQVVELDLAVLLHASQEIGEYRQVPRFPAMRRDLALVIDETISHREVEEIITVAGGELLREVRLFDLYRGEQLPAGKKSAAYSLTFFAQDRTLEESEVNEAEAAISEALSARGISIRAT